MKLIKLVVFQMIVGILFAFFFARLTIPEFKKFQVKILDIRGGRSFQLPERGTYLLNIFGDNIPEKVYFNSKRIVHSIFRNRAKLKEFYYIITPEFTTKGINSILIIPDDRYSIKILNNISSTDFGAVLFKSSVEKKPKSNTMLYFFATFICAAWGLAILYSLKFLFGLSIDNFFFKYCFSYVPCILLLILLYKISDFLPARLLFFEKSYVGVVALLILLFQIPALFNFIIREIVSRYHYSRPPNYSEIEYKHIYLEFLKISGKNASRKLLGFSAIVWFINKDFSDKCILFFVALLFSCAILLSFNLSFIAEFLANVAYLSLVTGVIIKLKNAKSEPKENRPA